MVNDAYYTDDTDVADSNLDETENEFNDDEAGDENYSMEDFRQELHNIGVSQTVEQGMVYYYGMNEGTFTAPATKFFDSDDYLDLVNDLRDGLEDDSGYFVDNFQAVITRSFETFPLKQLIVSAPIQQQRGLSNATVSNFFTKGATAFSKMPLLLFCPEVVYLASSGIRLVGGNHRIASVIKMLLDSGMELNAVLDTEIQCVTYTVDLDKLAEIMSVGETTPKKADILKQAAAIEFALWVGSNGSRAVTAQEVNEALSFARGVNRNDVDSIRAATFNKDKSRNTATISDALCWLYRLGMSSMSPFPRIEETNPHYFPVKLPVLGYEGGYQLKQTTMDSILRSFLTSLKTYKIESLPDSEGKTKKKSRWSLDLQDFDAFNDLVELLISASNTDPLQNPVVRAIEEVMNTLPSDSEYSGNVARNASAIGKALALYVNSNFNPQYMPEFAKAKTKESKKAPVKRSRRFK